MSFNLFGVLQCPTAFDNETSWILSNDGSYFDFDLPVHVICKHKPLRGCWRKGGIQSILSSKDVLGKMSRVFGKLSGLVWTGCVFCLLRTPYGRYETIQDIWFDGFIYERGQVELHAYAWEVNQRRFGLYVVCSSVSSRIASPAKSIYQQATN